MRSVHDGRRQSRPVPQSAPNGQDVLEDARFGVRTGATTTVVCGAGHVLSALLGHRRSPAPPPEPTGRPR
ncbi:hypothetical protein [Streptomyces pratensis]|uniref:hypothetical protein n=1 Tax=Streptomyces pratensis TaxID=1169025 RepID=UPI00301A94C0